MLLFSTFRPIYRNCFLTIASLLLFTAIALSQVDPEGKITVSGQVISSDETEPLIGVNILEAETSSGTITDYDGFYEVVVDANAVLVFSYIGYEDQEIRVDGRSKIDVVMISEAEILKDVIVVGYRKEIKSNIASAISSVKSEDIEKIPVLGFDQALQGQVSGLQVTQTTGAPGDDIAVRIRGVGTIGNNDPLYIIDGVPTTGNINMFSTSDIESIEILKDGSAAAIYGSRAAN
jgi:TonB-dependent SusC/RagA subfamily outer membrane receptor